MTRTILLIGSLIVAAVGMSACYSEINGKPYDCTWKPNVGLVCDELRVAKLP